MKHVSILVPKGNTILSSVVGPFKILMAVNQFLKQTGARAENFFDIHLVGLDRDYSLYDGLFSIHSDCIITEIDKTDLILIPALRPDKLIEDLDQNKEFVPWILNQRNVHNAEVASMCMGAFVLAQTGLVDGKQCATHWAAMEMFKKMFPQVDLVSNRIVTDEDGIYSSGGAFSFLNLMLHLVEKYCGRAVAIYISKFFEIDMDRVDQNQFAIFQGQKDHDDVAIKEAQKYIESNVKDKISVEQLAKKYAISSRNFVRRFKKATQNTPLEYIQRVKIEAAKRSLESTEQNVNEVMYQVGYADQKAFRTVFKKYAGLSPVAYKTKYNRGRVNFERPTAW
ncbi:GlxA family transcriptional regulator [Flagellimonas pacifica]|uniref:Transcriptional regulator, AraC family with amidase-like domain n=1 Tax=Flagellimonas pacifica TaxID=1247520 RepID=A0A285MD02_9FLAO|nr:helix-turn-helix domain-containing protein [Allomuricauda parva]SNY95055.1 transcriptional regulator, AraC family with amidase-like domain [Allomuricauda parva]